MTKLKSGWRVVKFDEIAQNVAVRVDPADAKTDIYVGLEHLDPSTIHLRQWGHPSDVTGQKLAFKKGDVIFGRRRAYQRKLAVAEFDGICSAHAMVVRAKPKMILPEFLPFFLQSDMFMERAIEISVGSLSPTINWKTLKVQEFPLPPLDEQKRIAEILWVADEALEKWTEAYRQSESALSSTRSQILQELSQTEECVFLKDVGRWVSGGTPSRSRSDFWNGDFPWVSPKDMKKDVISDSEEKLTDTALNGRVTILPSESILIVVRGMILAHTFPVAVTGREVTFNQDMKGIIPNSDFSAEYVFHWFKDNSARILQATEESTHGTKRLATDVLYGMQIPKPSSAKQEMVVTVFETFRTKLVEISEHIAASQQMLRSLRNAKVGAAHV
ncbi:restriction endonuclease subunit S [Desulfobulbus rhabdoformis]|jgi:restriction endonuclease S subunit|uniref:restriction endonuclease subunit S n=1 Tax=Desulfobulbus rhabdoformis TaxID=34032 RepID=UPI001962E037|nr:restriction endonuclease subunit S [Desulfobulbus rhabdoformis]MBM9615711.1 restriction endonuclease subunit S [Desulfobulbus rhabdoformis]